MAEKREKPRWEGKHYSFFQNTECEYFPCHQVADPARFNCLFCYCPLYMLGPHCGGNFRYTEKGIKDCTNCAIPHLPENYGRITGKYKEIVAAMRRNEDSQPEHPAKNDAVEKAVKANVGRDRRERAPFERIVMLACTERGFDTMRRAAAALAEVIPEAEILQTGRCAYVPGYEDGPRLSQATARWFAEADALIFFTATGIAVRCIAPFAQDKFRDPAVLVMDENGRFAISLMSGHAGGANRLCQMLAKATGAQPVITTATDGRGLFAVDVFAAENGLSISDRTIAKQISARILAGETLKIFFDKAPDSLEADFIDTDSVDACVSGQRDSDQCAEGNSPAEDSLSKYGEGICLATDRADADILLSYRRQPGDREGALYLIPRAVTLGIGCRKGIEAEAVRKAVLQTLQSSGVFRQALCGIASIDLKKEEAGLHAFAQEWELPLTFYTAEELSRVPGSFSSSDFVRSITGVDCVCERSAVRLALDGAGRSFEAFENEVFLLEKKQSLEGVTTALAVKMIKQLTAGTSCY